MKVSWSSYINHIIEICCRYGGALIEPDLHHSIEKFRTINCAIVIPTPINVQSNHLHRSIMNELKISIQSFTILNEMVATGIEFENVNSL